MLKNISLAALLLMALALAGLAVRGAFFSLHPLAISAEVASIVLMVWARLTFGLRSLHAAANPSAGGLVTMGAAIRSTPPPACSAGRVCWRTGP